MKTCTTCGESKDDGEFRNRKQCRLCYNAYQNAWYHAHREQVTERWRAQREADPDAVRAKEKAYWDTHRDQKRAKDTRYYAKNPEPIRQRSRDWSAANREQSRQASRAYYAAHRDERLAYQKEYVKRNRETVAASKRADYQRNGEIVRERTKRWIESHPEEARAHSRQTKTRRRAVAAISGHHTEAEWQAKLAEFGGRCAHCGTTENITRDHIIPLSKGGADTIDNIQPLCKPCNSKKGARLQSE